jgi:Ankyrin repeat
LDILEDLLDKEGLAVDSRDNSRYASPLMKAAGAGQQRIVAVLLERRARVDIKDNAGWDALCWACARAGTNDQAWTVSIEQTIAMLLKSLKDSVGANTYLRTTLTGNTPLMLFVKAYSAKRRKGRFAAKKCDPLNIVSLLLKVCKDQGELQWYLAAKNQFNQTALDMAEAQDIRERLTSDTQMLMDTLPKPQQERKISRGGSGSAVQKSSPIAMGPLHDVDDDDHDAAGAGTSLFSCGSRSDDYQSANSNEIDESDAPSRKSGRGCCSMW